MAVVVLATGGLALAGASMGTVALGSVLSSILGSTITVTGANLTATALIALVAGYINMNYILPDINNDYIRGTLQDINTFGMMFGLAGLASQALDYLGKKGQDWLNKKHPTNNPIKNIDWKIQTEKMEIHEDVHGRSGDLPAVSTPNSSKDLYVKGELWQRRYYDGDGNMVKDIDYVHNNSGKTVHEFPHEHYWKKTEDKWERTN